MEHQPLFGDKDDNTDHCSEQK